MLSFLIFGLIIVSGLIAYLGDQIGMKIGKKRLSVFGIRPKYTSIIITILTGIIIATSSVSLLMLASRSVRMAVFDMEGLVLELNRLKQEIRSMDGILEEQNQEIKAKEAELEVKEQEIIQKSTEIGDITLELEQIRVDRQRLQRQLEEKQSELDQLEEKLAAASMEMENVTTAKEALEEDKQKLETRIQDLEEQKQALETDTKTLEQNILALEQSKNEMEEKVNDLNEQMQTMSWQYGLSLLQYQTQDIVYKRDDLVYMESIKRIPGADIEVALAVVEDFLDRANKAVQEQNNNLKVNQSWEDRSIQFKDAKILQDLMEEIRRPDQSGRLIVQLYAARNTLAGEFLSADLRWSQNYIVHQANEIILQRRIDANQSPKQIQSELTYMLKDLNDISISQGSIPPINTNKSVTVKFDEFYKIFEMVNREEGIVMVAVMATKDIWREESLTPDNLKFVVTSVGEIP